MTLSTGVGRGRNATSHANVGEHNKKTRANAGVRRGKLLDILADHARNNRICPSAQRLGDQIGLTPRAVEKHLDALKHAGEIVVRPMGGAGKIITIPKLGLSTAHPTHWTQRHKAQPTAEQSAERTATLLSIAAKTKVPLAEHASEEDAIAEFIRLNGVTRAPAAFAAESQAGDSFNRRAVPKGSRYA